MVMDTAFVKVDIDKEKQRDKWFDLLTEQKKKNLWGKTVEHFEINEMLEMQKALQEKYKDIWKPICPERGKDQLLWMIGEIGEVIDILKKHGGENACQDSELREHLIEEMADVL